MPPSDRPSRPWYCVFSPGLDELAALVEVVAQRHRQVLLALGDGDVGHGSEQERVGEGVLRVLHQPVVARLPHHGVEVAQHAERMRDTLGVDVPRGVADAVGVEGGGVLVGVLRPGRAGGVRGVDAGVVLAGEDQRVGAAVGGHRVGEVLALDVATVAAGGEPHLHRVTRPGARHLAPELGVVAVALVAVALTALPLADVRPAGCGRR